jgi:hypothetical protein
MGYRAPVFSIASVNHSYAFYGMWWNSGESTGRPRGIVAPLCTTTRRNPQGLNAPEVSVGLSLGSFFNRRWHVGSCCISIVLLVPIHAHPLRQYRLRVRGNRTALCSPRGGVTRSRSSGCLLRLPSRARRCSRAYGPSPTRVASAIHAPPIFAGLGQLRRE